MALLELKQLGKTNQLPAVELKVEKGQCVVLQCNNHTAKVLHRIIIGEEEASCDGVYGSRCLIHRQGMPTVDWLNMVLMGRVNGTTVAWEDRSLKGAWTVDQGTNPGGAASLTVNGQLATTSTLKIGNTTLNETQLQQLLALLNP